MNLNKNEKKELEGVGEDSDSLPELRESDPEFVEMLKSCSPVPTPISNRTKQNIIDSYSENYKYRILWREIKIKIRQFLGSVSFIPRLNPVMVVAGIVILFIGTAVYYQYQLSKNTNPSNLASQNIPVIKQTPIATPSPQITSIPTPNIAENNNISNDNTLNTNAENQPNQKKLVSKNEEQNTEANKIKSSGKTNSNSLKGNELQNKIASNSSNKRISIDQASRTERSSDTTGTIVLLSQINSIYISKLIEPELRQELEQAVKTSGKLTLENEDNAKTTLKWSLSQPNTMIIRTKTNPLLWKKTVNKTITAKEQAEEIISTLIQSIELTSQKK